MSKEQQGKRMFDEIKVPVQRVSNAITEEHGTELHIKREDLIHPWISGNKWRKLKYNLEAAQQQNHNKLLTFGGAYSNHIAAVAAAGKKFGFSTIGVIRGEEHLPLNPTLAYARGEGMELHYLDRSSYRKKESEKCLNALTEQYGSFYLIPEGGSNAKAVRGCSEILEKENAQFDHICCPVGTGGTIAGLIAGMGDRQHVLGFSALKGGEFLKGKVLELLQAYCKEYSIDKDVGADRFEMITDAHRGGFAKVDEELIDFVNDFYMQFGIELDLIYTGKMMMRLYEMIKAGDLRGKKILAIHTGGVQGNRGFEERLGLKLVRE